MGLLLRIYLRHANALDVHNLFPLNIVVPLNSIVERPLNALHVVVWSRQRCCTYNCYCISITHCAILNKLPPAKGAPTIFKKVTHHCGLLQSQCPLLRDYHPDPSTSSQCRAPPAPLERCTSSPENGTVSAGVLGWPLPPLPLYLVIHNKHVDILGWLFDNK